MASEIAMRDLGNIAFCKCKGRKMFMREMKIGWPFQISMGNAIIVMVSTFLLFLLSFTKYSDFDLWWHLKNGEIIAQTGSIPALDAFSYSFESKPRFIAEWLGDLLLYGVFWAGGLAGLNVMKFVVLLATCYLLMRTMIGGVKDEGTAFLAGILTLTVVVLSLRFRLFIRPYLFSFFFFSLYLFIIDRYARTRSKGYLAGLPLLQIVWSNISVGAVLGVGLVGIYVIAEVVRRRLDFSIILVLVFVMVCSLVNPETYRIFSLSISALLGDGYRVVIGENQPLTTQMLWGAYGFRYTYAYQILVILALCNLALFEGWKNPYHVLLFVVFIIQSILQVRMIDFFSLAAAPLVFVAVARTVKAIVSRSALWEKIANATVTVVLVILSATVVGSNTYAFGTGLKEDTFPDGALAFLDREGISGRMFNSYPFGGYIIWSAPHRKVFIDGRHRHLYSAEFYNEYFDVLHDVKAWNVAADRWGFDHAIVEYDLRSRHFPPHLVENSQWALVYWDNHSAVYVKRIERYQDIIERLSYRITRPSFYDLSYLDQYIRKSKTQEVIKQIDSEIELNPANQEPRLAKAYVLYYMGPQYYDQALKELDSALALKPDLAMKHSARAILLFAKGRVEEANEELLKTLALDPTDGAARSLLKRRGKGTQ